jgi:hypothetical protein
MRETKPTGGYKVTVSFGGLLNRLKLQEGKARAGPNRRVDVDASVVEHRGISASENLTPPNRPDSEYGFCNISMTQI